MSSGLDVAAKKSVLACQGDRPVRIELHFATDDIEFQLHVGGRPLLHGPWLTRICVDGHEERVESGWLPRHWISNDTVDAIEIEALTSQHRIRRRIVLAKQDALLLITDAVLGQIETRVDYENALPLASGIRFQLAKDTREGSLHTRAREATILPLALPEWRSEFAAGELSQSDRVSWSLSSSSHKLLVPLFLDLNPRRTKKDLTWRRLTVAEKLQPQPPDVAVGYRVQIGDEQWLIYQSLGEWGNRSLLGYNLVSDFFVGRFSSKGKVETLIDIENHDAKSDPQLVLNAAAYTSSHHGTIHPGHVLHHMPHGELRPRVKTSPFRVDPRLPTR